MCPLTPNCKSGLALSPSLDSTDPDCSVQHCMGVSSHNVGKQRGKGRKGKRRQSHVLTQETKVIFLPLGRYLRGCGDTTQNLAEGFGYYCHAHSAPILFNHSLLYR